MISENQIDNVRGADIYGADGSKIGRAGGVYLDDETGRPEWATVHTGLFGTNESFVPLSEAQLEGDRVTVPFSKDQVKDAPNVDPDNGHLSLEEEGRLYEYYGLTATERPDGNGDGRGVVGHDTSGPTTDDAMTRSEEQLNVGTRQEESGRARLRKYVVTEQQSVQVPVSREEVRVEREPITEQNRGAALDGPEISEEEHEVTLREERPVVQKEAVPVERVRLTKEQVAAQETVTGDVRKEQIDTEGVEDTRDR